MIQNRFFFALCISILSSCIAYAQTNGRWIEFYETEKCIISYRSDIKTDRDKNHYVWFQATIVSLKDRLEISKELNSSVPVHSFMARIVFDSDFQLMKPLQFMVLSKSGKVLLEFKSEMLFEWIDLSNGDDFTDALKRQLRIQSGSIYEKSNRRPDKVYSITGRKTNKETNRQSSKVYDDLLAVIKEKQRKQKEETPKQSQFEDDDRIDTDVEKNYSPVETVKKETPAKEETKVFDVVEEMPQFSGGPQALFEYLSKSIKYPVEAEKNDIQGRVIVTYVVECDGSITDVNVVKSVDPSLDQEAIRVVKAMPRWIPGKQDGKPVRVKYTVPVTFRLQ